MSEETYDFGCTECEHRWDVVCDKMTAMDVYDEPCPGCGVAGENIKRGHTIDQMKPDYTQDSHKDGSRGRKAGGGWFDRQSALKKGSGEHQELLAKIHEGTPGSTLNHKMHK